MEVKFENGVVPIWKIRKGTVVSYRGFFYHVESFLHTYNQPGLDDLKIVVKNDNDFEQIVNPKFIEWLEPF